MPSAIVPVWQTIGSLWLVFVALAALLWFTGTLGGLLGIVAHGVQAVMAFGMNFLARTVALGAALGLVLLAVVVFKAVGAPDISSFFPKSSTGSGITQNGNPPPSAAASIIR